MFVRSFNPVWLFADLSGELFDDTFYMYVLENQVPYIPDTVYHTVNGSPWTQPIQFLANGTLPVDIYWDADKTYRLEFRQNDGTLPPSQNDALIYLVENYKPEGNGGSQPINLNLTTDNQITNPQFALLTVPIPRVDTGVSTQVIEIAPGWDLSLTGNGNVTIDRLALNNTTPTDTNAPYALRLNVSGWDTGGVVLRQRFQQAGMLWAGKSVSVSLTARIQGTQNPITASLFDSNGTLLSNILTETPSSQFEEYTRAAVLPASTNPNLPPAAFIEFRLSLPSNVDIFLTSFQIVVSDSPTPLAFGYEQDSVNRQIDHTWHIYRNSVLLQPKDSVLTGWQFGVNPWQFRSPSLSGLTQQTAYTADQTIIHQQSAGTNINITRITGLGRALRIQAQTNNNRFALIQYVDAQTISPFWGYIMSSLVKARIITSHNSQVRFKMRLIYRTTTPDPISPTEPIASWSGSADPQFGAGWTAIAPMNDPVYTFANSYDATLGQRAFPGYAFEKFSLPPATAGQQMMGIVLYTLDNMDSSGTADTINFANISLVPNEFAINANPVTFDECLRQCQFYYEKSYAINSIPGTAVTANNALLFTQPVRHETSFGVTSNTYYRFQFQIHYQRKRTTPDITIYSPTSSTPNLLEAAIRSGTATPAVTSGTNPRNLTAIDTSNAWQIASQSQTRAMFLANSIASVMITLGANPAKQNEIRLHFTADARLGRP